METDTSSEAETRTISIYPRQIDSSSGLLQRVGQFVQLAERVESSPLFDSSPPTLTALLTVDTRTGTTLGADLAVADHDPDQWELLLTRERALIFNETDAVHITQLASAIGKEHTGLRSATKVLGRQFYEWKATPLFAIQQLGPTDPADMPTVGNVQRMAWGPAGQVSALVDVETMTSDFSLTLLYANSQLWHADQDKTAVWNALPNLAQELARKAAETRAISASRLVHTALEFVRFCRSNGYDF